LAEKDKGARVALVTGASGGLGGEMAHALLGAGFRVILTGTNEAALRATMRDEAKERWRCIAADLSRSGAAETLARDAAAAFGRIDILINNAGINSSAIATETPGQPIRFWAIKDDMFRRFYQINTLSAVSLAAYLVPAMIERGWGRIVNVTTSLRTMLRYPAYGGSKAGLEAETACMAADLAGTGVTANVLLPGGPTATKMTATFGLPASEMLRPDIVIGPILYLASNASDGVSGKRFLAALWNRTLPDAEAATIAGAPAAWEALATEPIKPGPIKPRA
jgi:NAD(P)-dependent dehydrogenase (short-subunit alcohol dehydrogenase family)